MNRDELLNYSQMETEQLQQHAAAIEHELQLIRAELAKRESPKTAQSPELYQHRQQSADMKKALAAMALELEAIEKAKPPKPQHMTGRAGLECTRDAAIELWDVS